VALEAAARAGAKTAVVPWAGGASKDDADGVSVYRPMEGFTDDEVLEYVRAKGLPQPYGGWAREGGADVSPEEPGATQDAEDEEIRRKLAELGYM